MLEGLEHLAREPDLVGLLGRPRVGQPLDALGVGVVRRRKPTLGESELTEHVPDRLLDDLAVAGALGDDPRVEVGRDEDGVVVEHLLEVRHEPAVVDGVAMEAAADHVVEAARGHPVERRRDDLERAFVTSTQQELERRRRRKLRRAPEPSEGGLECRRDAACGLGEKRGSQRLARGGRGGGRPQRAVDPLGLALDVVAALAPRVGDRAEELREARHAVPRLGREVRPGVERLPARGS